jgi:hypothetical protein
MPLRDRTGPRGEGPMTGRRMGPCVGDPEEYLGRFGMGFGRSYGRGYYRRYW